MKRIAALGVTLTLGLTLATAEAQERSVHIGYFNWSDAMFTTNVVKYILEEEMDYQVELTKADPAAVYQGVASGDLDFHTDSWLPDTHADYYDQVMDRTVSLGPIYTDARLGWIVPSYVPEDAISSIEDLKSEEVRERLGGQIVGIDPGAGLTRLSKEAIEEYGLDDAGYELQISSGAGMTAALRRAIDREEWIVVTGWSPHWKFGRWDLRYIDDPKGVLGGLERADLLARRGFYRDHPEVYGMLSRIQIPIDDVQAGMYQAEESSYPEAARDYVESNPELVDYWVSGRM
ncbi:glycine betaine ABC transporter substrate-binding protein [Arhodomonas sp. SL1]|uniref:glycine betaine ABC transporter substrate-binding protein n=1 Tax=Arhodomonas sp. SL1 TaxID=3425691 RepID=UPI003F8817E2